MQPRAFLLLFTVLRTTQILSGLFFTAEFAFTLAYLQFGESEVENALHTCTLALISGLVCLCITAILNLLRIALREAIAQHHRQQQLVDRFNNHPLRRY